LASIGQPTPPPPPAGKKKKAPKKVREVGRFPAFYIDTFDEPEAMLDGNIEFEISSSVDSAASEVSEEVKMDVVVDPILVEYNERISRCPSQVLRYSRFGTPLLQEACDVQVPKCERCGKERVFEVELIPTVIYILDPESSMDFGPILVYTCADDCGDGCCEEFCYVCPP
jgi:pre-rRNA-processing protein TSR4